ncbi:MAG TPA: hypothetical protein VJ577_08950 [Burkholderiaceae bacterium]|nr:hypothetical protein [Burkholderiaceae bacterium]
MIVLIGFCIDFEYVSRTLKSAVQFSNLASAFIIHGRITCFPDIHSLLLLSRYITPAFLNVNLLPSLHDFNWCRNCNICHTHRKKPFRHATCSIRAANALAIGFRRNGMARHQVAASISLRIVRPIQGLPGVLSGIIRGLIAEEFIMEAERLNSLSALLADLTMREAELRRYL